MNTDYQTSGTRAKHKDSSFLNHFRKERNSLSPHSLNPNLVFYYRQRSQEIGVEEPEDPEIMFDILARLGQSILRANDMEKIEK